jgi:hypothetical protein
MPTNPLSDPKWAAQIADTIERVVALIRDRTTRPIIMIARGLVFGLLVAIIAPFALVVALVGLTRGIQAALDWPFAHDTSVWVSYLALGALLLLAGTICMSKRNPKEAS